MSCKPSVCPKCQTISHSGLSVGAASVTWRDEEVRLTGQEAIILRTIIARRFASVGQLIDALYWDDPEGGPLAPENVVSVLIVHLRRKLRRAGLPFEIRTEWGRGFTLVPAEPLLSAETLEKQQGVA